MPDSLPVVSARLRLSGVDKCVGEFQRVGWCFCVVVSGRAMRIGRRARRPPGPVALRISIGGAAGGAGSRAAGGGGGRAAHSREHVERTDQLSRDEEMARQLQQEEDQAARHHAVHHARHAAAVDAAGARGGHGWGAAAAGANGPNWLEAVMGRVNEIISNYHVAHGAAHGAAHGGRAARGIAGAQLHARGGPRGARGLAALQGRSAPLESLGISCSLLESLGISRDHSRGDEHARPALPGCCLPPFRPSALLPPAARSPRVLPRCPLSPAPFPCDARACGYRA